ncbi:MULTISPECIES: dihydroxyacetone kinase subunit DhaK [Fusobacterium]|uniref:dihydroxyacetone kinase subunit DhaK n=1 Tax=Fusobacterium TaxID=848 RepID=UPI001F3F93CE|nr:MULTISPECIES: dihydroxyacetone kinase subunit DhaK [Fusobacterium]MCF2611903.1 dihydroxyacetone kinase subunit DhaK [Fusobacterium perfoetens]MDY2980716.1 dihydroxyacetone kinase subunit DhaK [Fusobacterium sp.]
MKKMINKPENIVTEMIGGMLKAFPDYLEQVGDLPVVKRKNKKEGKVALISGGGSGHEPSHAGFVGYGMLDAAVAGEVFTSPSADKVYEAIKAVDSGNGVLLIIKNYSGDVMNFEMAAEMAGMEGINVKKIIVNDDIAVENSTYTVGRRGIAGTVLVHKMVGAAAEKGYSLDELEVLGNEVISRTKTMGMSLKPCMVPTTGKLSFELPEDEVEIGLGIHGEPGTHREKMQDANAHVDYLLDKILKESELSENDEVAVLVNGLGETTLIELYIINNRVSEVLANKNIKVYDTIVGNYMTSLDMGGFSITLVKLDDEMKELLKAKTDTPAFKRF